MLVYDTSFLRSADHARILAEPSVSASNYTHIAARDRDRAIEHWQRLVSQK